MDQVLAFHTILRQWFAKPLSMVQCNLVFKCWVQMRAWPDRAERLARILGSQATTCDLLLSQMDANLDFDIAAAQLHEAIRVDLNSIDLELVRAQRMGTNSQNKEPLVDWIIFTDRKTCAAPECEGQLTLDRPARVNGEGIAKKMKQMYNTKRSDSNATFLLSDQASVSTVGGPEELTVYVLSKWCSVCGAQHNCDRAIVKTWSSNGRAKVEKLYFYGNCLEGVYLQITDRLIVTNTFVLDMVRNILDMKAAFRSVAKKCSNVARAHDPSGIGSASHIPLWYTHKEIIRVFLVAGTLRMLKYYYGSAFHLQNFVQFATADDFDKFLIESTNPDGILARTLRRQGIQGSALSKKPIANFAIINDGCQNARRSICRSNGCIGSPLQGTEWCSRCCTVNLPSGVEVLNLKCNFKLKVSEEHASNRWSRMRGNITAFSRLPSCRCSTTDLRCAHGQWILQLNQTSELPTLQSASAINANVGSTCETVVTRPDTQQPPPTHQSQPQSLVVKATKFQVRDALAAEKLLGDDEPADASISFTCQWKESSVRKRNRTHGTQGFVNSSGLVLDISENADHGEGTRYVYDFGLRIMMEAAELGINYPLRDVCDTACKLLATSLLILVEHLKDPTGEHRGMAVPLYFRVAKLCLDVFHDTFHAPNHPDQLCKDMLHPATRLPYLRKLGWNSQLCEQLWALWLKLAKSANYMNEQTYRGFFLISAFLKNADEIDLDDRNEAPDDEDLDTEEDLDSPAATASFESPWVKDHKRQAKDADEEITQRILKESNASDLKNLRAWLGSNSSERRSWVSGRKPWNVPSHCNRPFPPGYQSIRDFPLSIFKDKPLVWLRILRPMIWAPKSRIDAEMRMIVRNNVQARLLLYHKSGWACNDTPEAIFMDSLDQWELHQSIVNTEQARKQFRAKYVGICFHYFTGEKIIDDNGDVVSDGSNPSEHYRIVDVTFYSESSRFELICEYMHKGMNDASLSAKNAGSQWRFPLTKSFYERFFRQIRESPYNENISYKSDTSKFEPYLKIWDVIPKLSSS